MTSDSNDHNKSTREAYHPLHLALIENAHSSTRLSSLVSTELLKLPEGFFEGKKCADLGCGSGAFGAINLLQMGAKYVHAMDLDGSFIAPAQKSLSKDASFEGRWQTDIGSVDDLPYDDGFFDFILCQGVIMLTADDQKSVDEIARTLKPGGKAFVTVMGKGGLATRMMMDVFRDEYHNNPEFEHFVEHDLNPEWIGDQVDYLLSTLNPDGTPAYEASKSFLNSLKVLIDEDFMLSFKDRMVAPLYRRYTEKQFNTMLELAGFTSWYRVALRPQYHNLRKVLEPLYSNFSHPLAHLLYGDGGALNIVMTR